MRSVIDRIAYALLGADPEKVEQHQRRIERELDEMQRREPLEDESAAIAAREFDRLLQELNRR